MQPAMTSGELNLLRSFFHKTHNYLEFGSGGSTVTACEIIRGSITSIESSQAWIAKVQAASPADAANRLRLIYADIGPTKELGYPRDDSCQNLWANYHTNVWPAMQGASPDTVLIDGRFRIACFIQTLIHTPPDTVVLVHDFRNRPHYSPMLKFGQEIASIDNLSAFVRRPDFDPEKAHAALPLHSHDPH